MDHLIEDYRNRINTINTMLEQRDKQEQTLEIDRLKTKLGCYRSILHELIRVRSKMRNHEFRDAKAFPKNEEIKNWQFEQDEVEEINLATAIVEVGQKSGSINNIDHTFQLVLRMLRSKCAWAE